MPAPLFVGSFEHQSNAHTPDCEWFCIQPGRGIWILSPSAILAEKLLKTPACNAILIHCMKIHKEGSIWHPLGVSFSRLKNQFFAILTIIIIIIPAASWVPANTRWPSAFNLLSLSPVSSARNLSLILRIPSSSTTLLSYRMALKTYDNRAENRSQSLLGFEISTILPILN